jgi:hypothetical protein
MLEEFDKQVSIWSESLARKFNRRKMVGGTVKGLVATVAAATVGQLANFGEAFAASCTCDDGWTTGQPCEHYGYPCPHNTSHTNPCPSQMKVCTINDSTHGCGGSCNYSSGNWVSCSGLGASGKGYKLCWDCTLISNPCHPNCSCLSDCFGC